MSFENAIPKNKKVIEKKPYSIPYETRLKGLIQGIE
jgi:hypothetical protein